MAVVLESLINNRADYLQDWLITGLVNNRAD